VRHCGIIDPERPAPAGVVQKMAHAIFHRARMRRFLERPGISLASRRLSVSDWLMATADDKRRPQPFRGFQWRVVRLRERREELAARPSIRHSLRHGNVPISGKITAKRRGNAPRTVCRCPVGCAERQLHLGRDGSELRLCFGAGRATGFFASEIKGLLLSRRVAPRPTQRARSCLYLFRGARPADVFEGCNSFTSRVPH
jgi:hypothetical protein